MSESGKIRRIIKIYGKVQGVGFRFSAMHKANEFDVSGIARNMPDGSVYIDAEALPEKMDKFIVWCHKGPASAIVKNVDIITEEVKGYSSFQITG